LKISTEVTSRPESGSSRMRTSGLSIERGDEKNTLAHPFGVRAQRNMPMRKQREKLEE